MSKLIFIAPEHLAPHHFYGYKFM